LLAERLHSSFFATTHWTIESFPFFSFL
jgi:hypothetical protein